MMYVFKKNASFSRIENFQSLYSFHRLQYLNSHTHSCMMFNGINKYLFWPKVFLKLSMWTHRDEIKYSVMPIAKLLETEN